MKSQVIAAARSNYDAAMIRSSAPVLYLLAALAAGCVDPAEDLDTADLTKPTTIASDFESGSIGVVQKTSDAEWTLSIRNDNDNATLPASFRTWWYVRFDRAPLAQPMTITVNNHGFPFYYVPVYSYDQRVWHRFDESEVVQPNTTTIVITKQFHRRTVWLARFYPYTLTDLEDYLDDVDRHPFVERDTVGTTALGRPLEVLTITNPMVADTAKQRIWIHARTHPAETGSSFVLEGLIDFLLGGSPNANLALSSFVFSIMPMHNVDGVVIGNYRTTPGSINLENSWRRDPADPFLLSADAPQEVKVLRDAMAATLEPGDIPVTVALNLHSSNSEPDTAAFFFPHFGPAALGYAPDEAELFTDQIAFTDSVESFYGVGRIEPRPADGGRSFVTNNFPESWWWASFGPSVNAITLETVYGRAGFAPRWVTPRDIRPLGRALVRSLLEGHDLLPASPRARSSARPVLLYPNLYPPAMEVQVKDH